MIMASTNLPNFILACEDCSVVFITIDPCMNEGIIFSNTDQKHKYLNMNITANIKKKWLVRSTCHDNKNLVHWKIHILIQNIKKNEGKDSNLVQHIKFSNMFHSKDMCPFNVTKCTYNNVCITEPIITGALMVIW